MKKGKASKGKGKQRQSHRLKKKSSIVKGEGKTSAILNLDSKTSGEKKRQTQTEEKEISSEQNLESRESPQTFIRKEKSPVSVKMAQLLEGSVVQETREQGGGNQVEIEEEEVETSIEKYENIQTKMDEPTFEDNVNLDILAKWLLGRLGILQKLYYNRKLSQQQSH